MDRIRQLYDTGATYLHYIDESEQIGWVEHLHYLHNMKLTEEESKLVKEISYPVKLLVFCESSCNDCRIFLAILENIRWVNPLLQYSIVDRYSNKDIMENIDQNCRIPLVIDINGNEPRVICSEFPEIVRAQMENLEQDGMDVIRENDRKGLFKSEVINQVITLLIIELHNSIKYKEMARCIHSGFMG